MTVNRSLEYKPQIWAYNCINIVAHIFLIFCILTPSLLNSLLQPFKRHLKFIKYVFFLILFGFPSRWHIPCALTQKILPPNFQAPLLVVSLKPTPLSAS